MASVTIARPRPRSPLAVMRSMRPADPVQVRIAALRRFAVAITILNFVGHRWLGFEQAIAQPILAVLTCYVTELFLETVDARRDGRLPAYKVENPDAALREKLRTMVNFLLPAHITGFALGMLLYIGSRLELFVIAGIVAISSKYVFRFLSASPGPRRHKHYFNPSNFGITVMLVLFSGTVSIAPPYQFTEYFGFKGDIILPVFITFLGTFVNFVFTGKIPLIMAWVGGFALQGIFRSIVDPNVSPWAAVSPLTGLALILFTMYMVTDPGTTPRSTRNQVIFGLSVAGVYGVLISQGIAFGVFFALTIVCAVRGTYLTVVNAQERRRVARAAAGGPGSGAGVDGNGADGNGADGNGDGDGADGDGAAPATTTVKGTKAGANGGSDPEHTMEPTGN